MQQRAVQHVSEGCRGGHAAHVGMCPIALQQTLARATLWPMAHSKSHQDRPVVALDSNQPNAPCDGGAHPASLALAPAAPSSKPAPTARGCTNCNCRGQCMAHGYPGTVPRCQAPCTHSRGTKHQQQQPTCLSAGPPPS